MQRIAQFVFDFALMLAASMSMKSITIRPPASRMRSWRAISTAASRFVLSAVSSMSPPLVAFAELMSIAVSASVWSITIEPPDGRRTLAFERVLDLRFDLETREQRNGVLVQLQLAQVLRHHLLHEIARVVVQLFAVDQDFADVVAQVVAQRADDQFGFLIDQERGRARLRRFVDRLPDLQQVIEVPLQFFGFAAHAGGADDQAHVVGQVEVIERFLEFGAIVAFDAARNAAGARVVRHQHQIAAGEGDERGQGSALVAAFFLVDLDDDFLAFLQQFADAGAVVVDAWQEVLREISFSGRKPWRSAP